MSTNPELEGIKKAKAAVLLRIVEILYRTPQHYAFTVRQTELDAALDLVERILTRDLPEVLASKKESEELLSELQEEKQVVQNFFNING